MKKDSFSIYQLKDDPSTRYLRYESFDLVQRMGCKVEAKNYNLVYTAPLYPSMTLEGIFTKFNIARPSDFTGHSLSVSDIVVISRNGKDKAYYVDSIGFKEIDDFLDLSEPTKAKHSVPSSVIQPVVEEIYSEGKLKQYLDFIILHNRMSAADSLILFSQNPAATQVATYDAWKSMGRQVRQGEKGVQLFFPAKYQAKLTVPKRDNDGNPILDKNGNPVMEKITKESFSYVSRYVFDVSQTEGAELNIAAAKTVKCENFDVALKLLRSLVLPYKVFIEDMPHLETNTYVDAEREIISVRAGLSNAQTLKCILQQVSAIQLEKFTTQPTQIEKQCVTYVLAKALGLEECVSSALDQPTQLSLNSFIRVKEAVKEPLYLLEQYQMQTLDLFAGMPPVSEQEQSEKLDRHFSIDKRERGMER